MENDNTEELIGRFMIHFKHTRKPSVYADDILAVDKLDNSIRLIIICSDDSIIFCDASDCIVHDIIPDDDAWKGVLKIKNYMLNSRNFIEDNVPGYA